MPFDGQVEQFTTHPSVNGEAILELAEFIEKSPLDLHMNTSMPRPECGSAGCIVGFATIRWFSGRSLMWTYDALRTAECLGITSEQARALFMPKGCELDRQTKQEAVATLRHLARTGEVNWETV